MTIRNATPNDAAQLLAIYKPYVEQTAISFEYDVPTEDAFRRRMESVIAHYPWLVATEGAEIAGYAYAGVFKERAAYQWAVETSIYLKTNWRRRGIGRQLHEALETALRKQGILNMNACITYAEPDDAYAPSDSIRFHQRLGYRQVAHFHQCGKKFGRWYDMIWMEKLIGEHR